MVQVNAKRLQGTVLGAILVITAVVIKNGGKQAKLDINEYVGPALFVVGWLVTALSLYDNVGEMPSTQQDMMALGSAMAIVVAVNMIMKGGKDSRVWPAVFVAGWTGIAAAAVGRRRSPMRLAQGAGVVGLVLGSMMYFLPKQRAACVVDGPGCYLFGAAWTLLAFLNATK